MPEFLSNSHGINLNSFTNWLIISAVSFCLAKSTDSTPEKYFLTATSWKSTSLTCTTYGNNVCSLLRGHNSGSKYLKIKDKLTRHRIFVGIKSLHLFLEKHNFEFERIPIPKICIYAFIYEYERSSNQFYPGQTHQLLK